MTEINGSPFSLTILTAEVVRAICISDRMPSCMRAPPELATVISGILCLTAYSAALTMPSPTAMPIEPPIKAKSSAATTHLMPPMVPVATLIASWLPVALR